MLFMSGLNTLIGEVAADDPTDHHDGLPLMWINALSGTLTKVVLLCGSAYVKIPRKSIQLPEL